MQINLEQARAILELALSDYSSVRGDYWADIYDAIYTYLAAPAPVWMTAYKNRMRKAMATAYNTTGDLAYLDGGGELPMDEETQGWLVARQTAEFGYIDSLFQSLKMLRGEEGTSPDQEAFRHADGYAKTLDSIYSNVKAMAANSKMLTLVGRDGARSCPECQKYKGQRHRARWWVAKNLVPGKGSAYSCGGFHCFHVLIDDQGALFSI